MHYITGRPTKFVGRYNYPMFLYSYNKLLFLELGITGVPLPTRLGGKQQVRQDEETILQSLLKEGLIAK